MVNDELLKLLDNYCVKKDFSNEIRNGYRNPLEDTLNIMFNEKPNYRYGGSLAKGTANTNSCDIDLLCYFDSDYDKSLKDIYDETKDALIKNNYFIECKNSAITVFGDIENKKWDISVDIVPGKYTSNDNNKDVFLWCNRDKKRLKSNPEIQIDKVKKSNCKDVIRIIKLYRYFNNFKFKSFYLEIFAIDVVAKDFRDNDSLYDKLVKFCGHYSDIGKIKLFDPANIDNNINNIHDEYEFDLIRKKISELYCALLTNNSTAIINCILGKSYDIDEAYLIDAKSHSLLLQTPRILIPMYAGVHLEGYFLGNGIWHNFSSQTILKKGLNLRFEISISPSISIKEVKLIVVNAGYDAMINCCLRGNGEEVKRESNIYVRDEKTAYIGNHFAQAIVITKVGNKIYSNILTVRIR